MTRTAPSAPVDAVGKIDEGRSPDADQHIGAQAGAALAILPLGADQGAQHEGDEQADQRIEEIVELESMDELHLTTSVSRRGILRPMSQPNKSLIPVKTLAAKCD